MTNIQISLPEWMKVFVEEQVAKGGYSSASEYLQELIFQDQQHKGQEGKRAQLMAKFQTQGKLNNQEFELIADKLADEFAAFRSNLPVLSDYAVTRESIYEDHPFTSHTQIFVDSHKFYKKFLLCLFLSFRSRQCH